MARPAKNPHYIIAVSGGVDSVVLLDMLYKHKIGPIVVAHVDHGMRGESKEDARFVRTLADSYGYKYELKELALGKEASENTARQARYEFFRALQKVYHGPIVTAHHADDVIETVVLHMQRGTGWRGLAVFGATDVYRPLTNFFKTELIDYAKIHELGWREDRTNAEPTYARNRIRPHVANLPVSTKLELLALWRTQKELAKNIDAEVDRFITYRRYFYIMASPDVAREVMRATLLKEGISRTRPQIDAAVQACKTAKSGAKHSLGRRVSMVFDVRDFRILSCGKECYTKKSGNSLDNNQKGR
jgi:tRNA(Ile)-lysidine synthetase-like protein